MAREDKDGSIWITLALGQRRIALCYPSTIGELIAALFGSIPGSAEAPDAAISVRQITDGRYAIAFDADTIASREVGDDLVGQLSNAVIGQLVDDMTSANALHAGAVLWKDQCIVVPGGTGSGKTSLVAWLLDRGCRLLSDELVLLAGKGRNVTGFPRGLVFKADGDRIIAQLPTFASALTVRSGGCTVVRAPDDITVTNGAFRCRLIIFPQYISGARISIAPVTPAEAALRLMACNINERNFEDGGLAAVTAVARQTPAFILQYGGFEQLDGTLDTLAEFVTELADDTTRTRRFLSAFGGVTFAKYVPPRRHDRHPATPRPQRSSKLTVGMATYDDYDGVYFTLQALRMFHAEVVDEVEFLVVDNHPDGPCAKALKDLEKWIPNYRYVPVSDRQGTVVRDVVFREAAGDFVLCIDCHVLIMANGIKALIDYFDTHPNSRDLIQGPHLSDDLSTASTHWVPQWGAGMFGSWQKGPVGDLPQFPFEIDFQGLGLFACRRDAWVGFHPQFRGFGGEEWYLHEKFRRAGGKVICLPALQWVHRYNRPMGLQYQASWEDRIRNYSLAFRELGRPADDMVAHFRELLGKDNADAIFDAIEAEISET